ncbi:MAG: carboxypeptidase regulatory-like domain-containing protein [bacterium]
MNTSIQRKRVYPVIFLVVLLGVWLFRGEILQAQSIKEPIGLSMNPQVQMALGSSLSLGGGLSSIMGSALATHSGLSLSASSPMLSLGGYSYPAAFMGGGMGGVSPSTGFSGLSLPGGYSLLGGGGFSMMPSMMPSVWGGLPMTGGGLLSGIGLPVDLSLFSSTLNQPRLITSLPTFYNPFSTNFRVTPFSGSQYSYPGNYPGGSSPYTLPSNPYGMMSNFYGSMSNFYGSMSNFYGMGSNPYGMISYPYGMGGGLSSGGGYSYMPSSSYGYPGWGGAYSPYGSYPSSSPYYTSSGSRWAQGVTNLPGSSYYDQFSSLFTTGFFTQNYLYPSGTSVPGTEPIFLFGRIITLDENGDKVGMEDAYIQIYIGNFVSALQTSYPIESGRDGYWPWIGTIEEGFVDPIRSPKGTYSFTVSLSGYQNTEAIGSYYQTSPIEILLVPEVRSLKGTVRDETTGKPMVKVAIKATSLATKYLPPASRWDGDTITDSQGKYELSLPAGKYIIQAFYPNLEATATRLSHPNTVLQGTGIGVNLHDNIQNFDLSLSLPVFSGTVIDELDIPIEDAIVKITPTPPVLTPIYTDSEGKFEVPLPGNTYYKVEVTADGYQKETITSLYIPETGRLGYDIKLEEENNSITNDPPEITSPKGIIEFEVGEMVVFSIDVHDNDNINFTYEVDAPSPWPDSNTKDYSYQTTLADLGEHTIMLRVTDFKDDDITFITVRVVYSMELKLEPGINLISYPVDQGETAFSLLPKLGNPNQVDSVLRYDPNEDVYERAGYHTAGVLPEGINFPASRQDGYLVYAKQPVTLNPKISSGTLVSCQYHLKEGLNLFGVTIIVDDGFSAYDFLSYLGQDLVESLYRFNTKRGGYEYSYWIGGQLGGVDFPIRMGEGYFIQMKSEETFSFPPGQYFR